MGTSFQLYAVPFLPSQPFCRLGSAVRWRGTIRLEDGLADYLWVVESWNFWLYVKCVCIWFLQDEFLLFERMHG